MRPIINLIGVSGGKDSTALLLWALHESGYDRSSLRVTFCDTGNEHEFTYAHIERLRAYAAQFGVVIETIKGPLDYFELALKKHRFPGAKSRFCTEELKIIPTQDWVAARVQEGFEVLSHSGVRAEEARPGSKYDRASLTEYDLNGYLLCRVRRPLLAWSLDDVKAIHRRHGIPLNPLYEAGAKRVGCWPCIMCRKEEIRLIALKFPERIEQIRIHEEKMQTVNGRYSTFFPFDKTPPRFRSRPYTAKDGREMMVPTIDDVVRWALTGKNARGAWDDQGELFDSPHACSSGFCE
jgi:3'-phosphoadenosine 5'-phosphosulfate sulfotransferase (PAPS reductase)/FAD synthetase